MKRPNEDYPRATPVGEEPGTGKETIDASSTKMKKRGLGKLALRHEKQDQNDSRREARGRREREISGLHSDAFGKLGGQIQWLDYLRDSNIYSYSKILPRRTKDMMGRGEGFDGSYDDLAEATLDRVLKDGIGEDDSFDLLNADKFMHQLYELEEGTPSQVGLAPEEASGIMKRDLRYHEGIPVLLWKLGLMEFDDEQSFVDGKGEQFSPNANWENTGPSSHYAKELVISLPYNGENVLHKKVADVVGQPVASLEFIIRKDQSGSYGRNTGLSMRVTNAIEQQEAQAA